MAVCLAACATDSKGPVPDAGVDTPAGICGPTAEDWGCPSTRAAAVQKFLQCKTSLHDGLSPWPTAVDAGTGPVCTLRYSGGFLPIEGPFAGRCGVLDMVGEEAMGGLYCYYDNGSQLLVGAHKFSDGTGSTCENGSVGVLAGCKPTALDLAAECVQDAASGACNLVTYFP
jgi:hypothetical protein